MQMTLQTFKETFFSAVMAGFAIGAGGFCYATLGGVAGAVLFTFGLLTVVHYRWKLYTGVIGFIEHWSEVGPTFVVLLGNIVGCLLIALMAKCSPGSVCESAGNILAARLSTGALKCGVLAIGCGFVVTTAVTFGRQDKWLPLLFGVPLFIVCGFPHCIADAFYYLAAPWSSFSWSIVPLYLCIVAGNFLGCNLSRLVLLPARQK